jgi:cation:H+ antiporter
VPGRLVGVGITLPAEAHLSLLLFIASLAVTLFAARMFARRLDRLGLRFGLPEVVIGLLTALAADGPEISSALFALIKGAHGVSVGVLVGSNTFNLATMLGLSALLAGRVCPPRGTLAVVGAASGAVTVIAVAALLGWIAPAVAVVLAAVVLVPYFVRELKAAEDAAEPVERISRVPWDDPTHHLLALIVVDVALIIAGSAGMVQAALTLGHEWGIPRVLLGTLVLGPLTSIPNAMTGVRLGLASRAQALVGEALNSNTINLAFGAVVPGLFVTLAASTLTDRLELWWLLGTTAVTLLLLARREGLGRLGGALLIALYGGFVAIALAGA